MNETADRSFVALIGIMYGIVIGACQSVEAGYFYALGVISISAADSVCRLISKKFTAEAKL